MRLRSQGVQWGDDRPCPVVVTVAMVDGAGGQLAIVADDIDLDDLDFIEALDGLPAE